VHYLVLKFFDAILQRRRRRFVKPTQFRPYTGRFYHDFCNWLRNVGP